MMKFQAAISAGLAAIVVIPTVTLGGDEIATLEDALSSTVRTLEIVTGIGKKAEEGDDAAPGLIRSITESPILDPRKRDDRLNALRNEVNLLQTELDLIEGCDLEVPATLAEVSTNEDLFVAATAPAAEAAPEVTTGLDDATRRTLYDLQRKDRTGEDPVAETASPARTSSEVAHGESADYSAAPLLHARTCYRVGRFEEAAALLKDLETDPQALYWRARSLEKLDRLEEAAACLRRVIALAPETHEGKSAKSDLEFVEWKKDFLDKLNGSPKGGRRSR
jgi:tetratricopeptide (TPR) repeat protein